jgi:Asp-tRNA(Asn)/Glu-tRNA(Gln) amidotransferase A subunit family amidase
VNANQIAREIASGTISAREAVTCCIQRIESTHTALNAVVVARFDEGAEKKRIFQAFSCYLNP